MVDTAYTIITDALLDIGVIADEEVPTASQAAGALRKLNNMIDSWNIESLMVYGQKPTVLPFTSNKAVYTIGPGGDFNIARPPVVTGAYIRDLTLPAGQTADLQLYIMTGQEWQEFPFKSQVGTYPTAVYFDYDYPLVQAYINPIANTSQYALVIWTTGLISNFLLNDPVTLAPGYKRALTSNLCIELAASYEVQVAASIAMIAKDSKKQLKLSNFEMDEMALPDDAPGFYDIRTNGVYR